MVMMSSREAVEQAGLVVVEVVGSLRTSSAGRSQSLAAVEAGNQLECTCLL